MLTSRVYTDDKNYERHYVVAAINEETLRQAESTFDIYRKNGVILSGSFSDDEWVLTNQVKKTTLSFCSNEIMFKRYAEKWIGCSCRCFTDGMKAYAIFQMGSIALAGIKEIVKKLMCVTEKPHTELNADIHIIEFLKLLPDNEIKDQVIEEMEERSMFSPQTKANKRQRILAEFDAYFRFNDALEEFWINANDDEKLFYFPMYFWWTLTAILPLRPTEFLLIPRMCTEKKNGENILTIRRTNLKGGKKKICYSINGDYRLMKYSVPDSMAAELKEYINATVKMPLSKLGTLFVQEPHYSHIGKSAPNSSSYYSYQNLSYCLKRFQYDIMKIEEDKNRINLGDTRHLAMISLIASGGSPVICKELAGHSDINISSHYYSNISRFVECATYEMYRRQKGGSVDMMSHKPYSTGETVKVGGGRCDSAAYIAGSISDCIRNVGTSGELGNCMFCPHFIDGKSGKYLIFSNAGDTKNHVDADSKYLMHVLETVRKGKGCNEDIQSALLRLQHSSARYSQCLYKNMEVL